MYVPSAWMCTCCAHFILSFYLCGFGTAGNPRMHFTLASQRRMLWCNVLQKFIPVYLVVEKMPFFYPAFHLHFGYCKVNIYEGMLSAVGGTKEAVQRQIGRRCRSIKSKVVDYLPRRWSCSDKGTVGKKPSRNVGLPYIGAITSWSSHASSCLSSNTKQICHTADIAKGLKLVFGNLFDASNEHMNLDKAAQFHDWAALSLCSSNLWWISLSINQTETKTKPSHSAKFFLDTQLFS